MVKKVLQVAVLISCLIVQVFAISCNGNKFSAKMPSEEDVKLLESSAVIKEGDFISFGSYPQNDCIITNLSYSKEKMVWLDNSGNTYRLENGKYYDTLGKAYIYQMGRLFYLEPLTWEVLECDDNTALLVCVNIIDARPYSQNNNNYSTSEIRGWLNLEFYNTAFSSTDQQRIISSVVDNSSASTDCDYNNYVCENTEDKVFLLSYQEVVNANIFASATQRVKFVTEYAKLRGAHSEMGKGWWWLRSPSVNFIEYANLVSKNGDVLNDYVYDTKGGVVPAIRIAL